MYQPVADPPSRLARYRRVAPSAAVFVSPIQLDGMSIGGNFIDTANSYQNGRFEEIIGKWMEARQNRDEIVLATKYTSQWQQHNPAIKSQATLVGNSYKSVYTSLEGSLRKLRTSYMDILYVHFRDYSTPIEEMVNGLHTLVGFGNVLCLGISDAPAWVVSEANRYAKDHGKTHFVIYQGLWNVFTRDIERDIIPMCRAHGMAIAPWNLLLQGTIRTDEEEEARRNAGVKGRARFTTSWERDESEKKICKVLEKIANELGAKNLRSVANAYVMQKTTHVFPILGVKSVEQLEANVDAPNIALTPEHTTEIESVLPWN
ncbi:unnamed protein product [Somion occarium]|uniref:NADP-dependent oxidoreductase domain-containing protein n=1 Tax=Somion occarium TaxID=3059160 RepID=A0ABP1D0G9_9APHY